MEKDRGINITPILNHILGLENIKTEAQFNALIAALKELEDDPRFTFDNLAKLMTSMKMKEAKTP